MNGPLASWIPPHWNESQRDVWRSLEVHWDHLIHKRIDAFLEFIHPEFIGYGHESPLPVDKPWLQKWVGFWARTTDIVICELRPVDCRLHGPDLAVLQYLIFTIEKGLEHTRRVIRRYTMTWRRGAEHWVVIASHNNLMKETV